MEKLNNMHSTDGITAAGATDSVFGDNFGEDEFYPVVNPQAGSKIKTACCQLLDFLLPRHLVCHCCDREVVVNEYGLCRECEAALKYASYAGMIKNIDGVTSGLLYDEPASTALRNFKYNGQLYKKEFFIHFMKVPLSWEFDYVVPIPLHPKRMRERGYNQSEVLAKELCRLYGFHLGLDFVERKRYTPKQANLGAADRRKSVKGAFIASSKSKDKSFLLVDDVRTTGGTLSECALALKKKGASHVYAITACCALTSKHRTTSK